MTNAKGRCSIDFGMIGVSFPLDKTGSAQVPLDFPKPSIASMQRFFGSNKHIILLSSRGGPMNVSNIIKRHLKETPEKTAIIFEDRRISYADLDTLINRTAHGLLKMGLRRGDIVSLFLPSLPELIISYLGTVRAGLTVNVVNAMLREQEVAYILKDCQSRAVIVDDTRLPIVESVRSELASLEMIVVHGIETSGKYASLSSVTRSGDPEFEAEEKR